MKDVYLGVRMWRSYTFRLRDQFLLYYSGSELVGRIPIEAIDRVIYHLDTTKKDSHTRLNLKLLGEWEIELKASSTAEKRCWDLYLKKALANVRRTGAIESFKDREYWHGDVADDVRQKIQEVLDLGKAKTPHVQLVLSEREQNESKKRYYLSQKLSELSAPRSSRQASMDAGVLPDSTGSDSSKFIIPRRRPAVSTNVSNPTLTTKNTNTKAGKDYKITIQGPSGMILNSEKIDRGLSDQKVDETARISMLQPADEETKPTGTTAVHPRQPSAVDDVLAML
mmetsp:Transcript_4136/g.7925  ORF Transcript_4136/g.7925 Transcript_4136/m.7925 type:complete len:282 (+) Transcript_4136:259-1104(+)